jgi:uncharacterized protein
MEVDDLFYELLDHYPEKPAEEAVRVLGKRYPEQDIIEAMAELDRLKEQNLLFSDEDFSFALNSLKNRQNVKALCLNVAHDCNLRCRYCFASRGDYRGKRGLMTAEVGRKAVDFLVERSGDLKNLEIDFFGGEPLMALDTIKEVVSYARNLGKTHGKVFHFTVTTNATILNDEIIEYLHENMDNIVLSMDGRKEVNDFMRVGTDGSGTYDKIVPNIKKLVALRERDHKDYYVRGTFTRYNLDFSEDVFHLADLGFKEISIEPVVGRQGEYLLKDEDAGAIYRQYERIAEELLNRGDGRKSFRFYHFNIDIYHGPCIYKRLSACGAGREYLAVTPGGDIYPCHQFVGQEEFAMGNVFEKILDERVIECFKNTHVFSKQKCIDCWARFFCSGGCNANNFLVNGDMNIPYEMTCKLQKKRIEYAIYLGIKRGKARKKAMNTMC